MQFVSKTTTQATAINANSTVNTVVQDVSTLAIARSAPKIVNTQGRRYSISRTIAKKLMVALFAVIFPLSQATSVLANEIGTSNTNIATSAVNASHNHNVEAPNYVAAAAHAVTSINPTVVNPTVEITNILHSVVNSSLDLSSVLHNVDVGNLSHDVALSVGGHNVEVLSNQSLTPAEALAVSQVLVTNHQSLVLDALGQAVGGSLNASSLGNNVNNLQVASGVTLVDNAQSLTLTGNLANYGDIVFSGSGNLTANNILNEGGAQISANGVLGLTTHELINEGGIYGANGVNINASVIYNSATIEAGLGNINIANANALDITGTQNSVFEAVNGDISIDVNATSLSNGISNNGINLAYSNYVSNELNLNAGTGYIQGATGNVTGQININANDAHLATASKDMLLGNDLVNGDPTYVNTTGNISLNGTVASNGANLAIIASGNINVASGASANITTTITSGDSGNLVMIAGASITYTGTNTTTGIPTPGLAIASGETVTVNLGNVSTTGGSIDLGTNNSYAGKGLNVIDTSSTTGNGGNVTLVALANGGSGGTISTYNSATTTTFNIEATGAATTSSNTYSGGNVLVIADAAPTTSTTTIVLGNITTNGALGGAGSVGSVGLYAQSPNSSSVSFDSNGNLTGTITNSGTNIANAGISVGSIITNGYNGIDNSSLSSGVAGGNGQDAGNVTISAGGNITLTGAITAGGGNGGGGAGGAVGSGSGGSGGSGGEISLTSVSGSISTAAIESFGGGGGAGGTSGVSGGSGGAGGAGGQILLTTVSGSISSTAAIESFGGGGGTGGSGGGNGGASGNGGIGGQISLTSVSGSISTAAIESFGGAGGAGGPGGGPGRAGGVGGVGGQILLTSVSGYISTAAIGSFGGAGGSSGGAGGAGGAGGQISLTSDSGSISTAAIESYGGAGGAGGYGGGVGGAGGDSNSVNVSTSSTVNINGNVTSVGGGGGGGGSGIVSGGVGGSSKNVTLFSNFSINISGSVLVASGGNGGAGGNNGSGGGGGGSLGMGGSGGFGTGSNGSNGNTTGIGIGGAAGGSDANAGSNAGTSTTADAGQITISAPSISITGSISFPSGASSSINAQGLGGTVDMTAPAVVSNLNYLSNADYARGSSTSPISITNTGSITTTGSIYAGTPNSFTPITLYRTNYASPITSGTFTGSSSASLTITESGSPISVANNTQLTPAEFIAAIQVSTTGTQSIVLTGTGAGTGYATGGSFNIASANIPTSNFTNLNLPTGVTENVSVASLTYTGTAVINGNMNFSDSAASLNIGSSTNIGGVVSFNGTGSNSIVSAGSLIATGSILDPNSGNLSIQTTNGSINLVAVNVGIGNLSVSAGGASGAITLNGTLSAAVVDLTANSSGGITVNATVGESTGLDVFDSKGTGNITTGANGVIVGDSLSLTSNGGEIGFNGNGLITQANNIVFSAGLSVGINNTSSNLNIGNSGSGANVYVITTGNLAGSGIITAPVVGLYSINGTNGIGSSGNLMQVDAHNIGIEAFAKGSSAYVSDTYNGSTVLQASQAGNIFKLDLAGALTIYAQISQGGMTTPGKISGSIIAIAANDANGGYGIYNDANIVSNDFIFLTASATGYIAEPNTGALMYAPNIALVSGGGAIGAGPVGSRLLVNSANVAASTLGLNNFVNIYDEAANSGIVGGQSGSSFTFNTNGNLNIIGSVATGAGTGANGGAINITANGLLNLGVNGTGINLTTNNGPIVVVNNDASSGSINFAKGDYVYTNTPSTAVPGYVVFNIGAYAQTNTTNPNPTNITASSSGGASIFYGVNGISAPGGGNVLNAKGQSIVFNTGSLAASAISLGGNVSITADPPVVINNTLGNFFGSSANNAFSSSNAASTYSASLSPIASLSGAGIIQNNLSNITLANSTQASTVNLGVNNNASVNVLDNTQVTTLTNNNSVNNNNACEYSYLSDSYDSNELVDNTSLVIPIAYSQTVDSITGQSNKANNGLAAKLASKCQTSGLNNLADSYNNTSLGYGSAIISANHDMEINLGKSVKLSLKHGAIVLAIANGNVVSVYDLHDNSANSVVVTGNGVNAVALAPGRQVTIAKANTAIDFAYVNQVGKIAYRGLNTTLKIGNAIYVSDFSIPSAITAVKQLKSMFKSNDAKIKALANQVLKTIVVVTQATAGRGVYEQVTKPKLTAMR